MVETSTIQKRQSHEGWLLDCIVQPPVGRNILSIVWQPSGGGRLLPIVRPPSGG